MRPNLILNGCGVRLRGQMRRFFFGERMPSSEQVRLLTIDNMAFVKRLLSASEYIYQRFTFDELPMLLKHYPAVGMFRGNSLQSFLLAQTVNAPSAWKGGFGVNWSESRSYIPMLDTLLDHLIPLLGNRGLP